MRVKEMADLAGTTTRTVRHYHALGLLPVPETHGLQRDYGFGLQRDYGFGHLARLMRIRWLADSGLALDTIKGMLDEDEGGHDTTIADLEATRAEMDSRIAQLIHQRGRIDGLLARAKDGEDITKALPGALEVFYEDMERRLTRPGARRLLNDKRNVGAYLMTTKLFPATALTLFLDEFNEDERAECADLLDRFDALADLDPAAPATATEVEAMTDASWALMARHSRSAPELIRLIPGGRLSKALWSRLSLLIPLAFRIPAQRAVIGSILARIATDPNYAPVLDDALKKEWTHDIDAHRSRRPRQEIREGQGPRRPRPER